MFNLLETEKSITKKYQPLLNQINLFENTVKNLTDNELKENIHKLKKKYFLSQKLSEDLIIQSFSLTREASIRTIGLRHFNEQIIGGLVLNEGKIAEMKTGEGKTLVATLPASLNALSRKGVHIVTVNDYLAKRDLEWMQQVYRHLGLTSGLIQSQMKEDERRKSYQKDITYITNSELGFDYLRDNMAFSSSQLVQRPFNYCIIDEVDSILIDEARTPLIISGQVPTNSNIYIQASEISKYLRKNIDFEMDEKTTNITLTENGIKQIEKILSITNIFETKQPWLFFVVNALRANNFFLKDVQYIVRNNKICIVDEFTGRIMPERRWNNGLHEAIEAKENIYVNQSSKQLAAITYQNFFMLYPKLSGMTGTAKTAELELEKIYNMEVVVIPTVKPFKREDLADRVYINEIAKWKAVAKTCVSMYKIGRPTLIGTNSIEKSEIVSLLLKDCNIPHKVLNAKPENLKLESQIIAEAGCINSIIISTNMAGRGTDIILGGSLNFKIKKKLIKTLMFIEKLKIQQKPLKFFLLKLLVEKIGKKEKSFSKEKFEDLIDLNLIKNKNEKWLKKLINILFFYIKINYKIQSNIEKKKVQEIGGLFVIGTERHESRRIDNQLRGRAGRQGDLGSSRFFISLEDKIFRLFGGNNIKKLIKTFQLSNDTIPLESNLLTKSLDLAQEKVENYYYEIRKNVYDYDEVLNEQRKVFYSTRALVLNTPTIRNWVLDLGEYVILEVISYFKKVENKISNEVLEQDLFELKKLLGFSFNLDFQTMKKLPPLLLFNFLREQFWLTYDIKEISLEIMDPGFYREFERICLLQAIDFCWSEHLQKMAELRESIVWRAYAQRDPLIEYKQEGYRLFTITLKQIRNFLIFAVLSTDLM
jgi:preprotein translocase subunit SecA